MQSGRRFFFFFAQHKAIFFTLFLFLSLERAKWSFGNILTIWLQVGLRWSEPSCVCIWYFSLIYNSCCTLPHVLELCRINEHQKVALDLDPYVKKLLNARRRVVLVNNILQNAQVCEFILLFSLFCLGTPHYTFLNFPTVPLSAVVQTALQYMTQSRSQPSSLLFTGALATAEPQRCQGNGTQEDHAGDVGSFHTSFPQQALMQLTSSHLQRLRLHHNTLSWLGTLPSGFWGGGRSDTLARGDLTSMRH